MPQKRANPAGDQDPDGDGAMMKKRKLDGTLFGEVLSESGFILNFSNKPYMLDTDQALFQRRLSKSLRAHPVHCHPASTQEFMRGLDTHLADNGHLKWALLYTETSPTASTARGGHQDSLVRLLLNIDELQMPLITLLTERLLEVAYTLSSDDDHSLPRLILANLQRLDRLTDAPAVSGKMLQLLDGAPVEVQKDIITFMPEIVDDTSHPKIAEKLCELYYSAPDLSVTILDALPGLSLSMEALLDVKHSVQKTVQAARPDQLPVVVKFLLEDSGRAEELVADLRRQVRLRPAAGGDSQSAAPADDSASHEMALLHNIKFAFQVDRRQHMSWLKALDGVAPPEQHHPLDVLLTLQLHDTAPARQRLVEAVLKKKVRAGVFTRHVLQLTFAGHAQTLKQFSSTIRRLAAFLIRCPEPSVSSYGAEMYRLAFVSFSGHQQQEVVLGALSHSADPPSVRGAVLQLLQTLADQHTQALARYSSLLQSWLDMLDDLTLAEVRQLMCVLSTLAFRCPEQAASVGDEIRLLIHKQLANSSPRYKRLGVVSVLMAIQCRQDGDTSAISASSDNSQPSHSQSSDIILTTDGQRETVQLLQMAQAAVVSAPAARGLLLDDLGSQVWRAGLDVKIERWICDQMMDEFQETFVVDLPDVEPQCDRLRLTLKYGLEEAGAGDIALNLAPMVMDSADQVVTLCPHFRLLRMCVASLNGGDMEKLDALLGCPILMPADDVIEGFSALSTSLRHTVLTSLFYCINFFRELLNAFSTQKDQELKRRCVLRLRTVLELEAQLRSCLPLVPGFVPPAACFDSNTPPAPPAGHTKKHKPAAKRKTKGKAAAKSPDATANQSAISQLEAGTPEERTNEEAARVELTGYRPFFRELDMDVYKLLYRRFSLTDNTSEEFCVRPRELQLLLDDLTLKLERRLAVAPATGLAAMHAASEARGRGFSHLDLLPEVSVARQVATLLKPLSLIADSIISMFKSQISDNDGVLDGPGMFGEEPDRLAVCLAAVYRIVGLLLAWTAVAEPENRELAREALGNLRLSDGGRSQLSGSQLASAADRAFALLEQHAAVVPRIECAANLVRTLSALATHSGEAGLRETLADCAEALLKREWLCGPGVRQTGAVLASRVDALLALCLSSAASRLRRLETLACTALPELLDGAGREPASETFPTLTKATFGHYYRSLFSGLVEAIRGTSGAERRHLDHWAVALKVFNQLVSCLKVYSSRSAVGVCLKFSRRLVDMFVKHAIPMLEVMLKDQKDDVLNILKNFQLSARYLHHVCNHSKAMQDSSLMNHVPLLKKGLEAFVFRVKAMLALNGCTNAFWMGNLKNRDLHGDEILSQSQQTEEDDRQEEQDEQDEQEEQSDVDLDAEEERASSPERANVEKQESEISDAY